MLDILAPVNITRTMIVTEDKQNLPQKLLWFNRAAKPNCSDDEITMKQRTRVFAADIIAVNSRALTRDTGELAFEQHEKVKLKHGYSFDERMIKDYRRISQGKAMDNEITSWMSNTTKRAAELRLGIEQRWETMVNGMLADGYNYERLGIRAEGTWGMPADLKFVPSTAHDEITATPLQDVVVALFYASNTYGEDYDRITCEQEWITNVVRTTEFKDIYKTNAAKYLLLPDSHVDVKTANPTSLVPFLSAYFSEQMGWNITVETSRGKYREFSPSTIRAPMAFHPHGFLFFTNSGDDNGQTGWDLGKGEVMEAVVGSMGGSAIFGDFGGFKDFYGPIAYATPQNPHLNPPGWALWAADEGAPRRHRDTCSARFRWN